jgi:K+-transporting ATPase KdpF subunit
MGLEDAVVLTLACGLLVYIVMTLLWPEKF